MPSEERGRYAIAGVPGASLQSVGPDGQPKRQLFDFGATNEKRSRDRRRKKEGGQKRETVSVAPKTILQTPVILERRDAKPSPQLDRNPPSSRSRPEDMHPMQEEAPNAASITKIMDSFESFRVDAALRALADYPGHFVVGVIGKQGAGKSTVLSAFSEDPQNTFTIAPATKPLDHQTTGIDMYVTAERIILLDTQPVLSWSVLEHTLRYGSLDGIPAEIWRDLKSLHSIMFLLAISDVILVVSEGADADMEMIRCLKRADMLKHGIPEFPLIPLEKLGLSRPEMNVQPQIVFVNNKCSELELCQQVYDRNNLLLKSVLSDSKLEWQGLISFSNALPRFNKDTELPNLFLLPYSWHYKHSEKVEAAEELESMDDLLRHLRNQVFAATRKSGKRGQISERDWFRNAVKTYDLILKSELVAEYLKTLRRIKNG
ncbi:hypothetical protein K450DRAFT_249978 [Umbelopsis ramanniana AG]|uniref:Protein SMG9 n=1 Tax=Umbelopsis ramanniana AG TaxID=1314678 RepID=A0AAD5E5D7_UMBRA|nr:uncharacterized protein K450DRAFT_249978 [Umbelopsis ramanniana AG]KAI8577783.1 hypothetical protein K450DRAFT_249978 [Umbelopsis ramanniana AG]